MSDPGKALPLSAFVVTLNEEASLRRCLDSLGGIAGEIIVADSGSTDGTGKIAEEFGAKWHHRDWSGFRDQKNFALSKCTGEWVLCLDADEELSEKLREEIAEIVGGAEPDVAGAEFPRLSKFLGRWIRHGDWYPDRQLRLFRRERGKFAGDSGHDHVEVDGTVRRLKGQLLHYSYPDMNTFVSKVAGFSDAFLESKLQRGKKWSLLGNLFRPPWRFFRGYVLRLGFLDGFPGYWIAKSAAYSTFLRHSRLYEHQYATPKDEKDA